MTELVSGVAQAKPYDLDDRYRSGSGPVLLTGVQAIARGFVEQHVRDIRAGKRIATFVSGYQGSPLGGVDKMLHGMPKVLAEHDITFIPGFNEELAATAVWGSQTDLPAGTATHDGVTGVWYGKGPGVDRATDTIRHANMYGVNPKGGVVLLVGDDPASKSSTVPAVSERSLAAMGVPVLFPRNAEEIITMGMHAVALSRVSGCVVALKIVADVADGAWTIDGSIADFDIVVSGSAVRGQALRLQAASDGRAAGQCHRRGRSVRPAMGSCARVRNCQQPRCDRGQPLRCEDRYRRHRYNFRLRPSSFGRPRRR